MKFAPKPENDFADFIRIYYRECRSRFPKIEGIAGKWMFRDLIPGMSDFDTRFILNDDMTADDWCRFSMVLGDTHLMLCNKYPCWARNFEHLPGVNPTWNELTAEESYYPGYQQWTYYDTEHPDKISRALDTYTRRPWDVADEHFHLKTFTAYYGRYNRTIDPPINMGVHENKYPLHSRIMHYFNPPARSAICLILKQTIPGKFDAFEIAQGLFPDLRCWELIREILHANYETLKWYQEPHVSELEDELEHALQVMATRLLEVTDLIPKNAGTNIGAWKTALQAVDLDPAQVIFSSAKFSRTMKGRLDFYCRAPAHFDSIWLIQNELKRIGNLFFRVPFRTFWKLKAGETVPDPVTIIDHLRGEYITDTQAEATKEFARLTPGNWQEGEELEIAAAIVDVYDDFFKALTNIGQAV